MTDPQSPLMQIVLSFLTPLMLAAGITDTDLAGRAAQEAIAACPTESPLLNTAQIVGFAMAALDSLRLSVAAEQSVTKKLRLRGNANALNRSSQRAAAHHTALTQPPRPAHAPPTPLPAQPNRTVELAWADAMTEVAAECSRKLAKMPPRQRRAEVIRIAALNATAQQLKSKPIGATETSLHNSPV